MRIAIVALALAVLAVTWTIMAGARSNEDPDLFAYKDVAVVGEGARLYSENCASCHGAALEGQPNWRERDAQGYLPAPPHDETGHTWHHPTAQLIEITRIGTERIVGGGYKSRMPGFEASLSDADISAVLAYIKSTWPEHIIERHDQINADSQS
jgi:mono/diheme cytochrome c family protein